MAEVGDPGAGECLTERLLARAGVDNGGQAGTVRVSENEARPAQIWAKISVGRKRSGVRIRVAPLREVLAGQRHVRRAVPGFALVCGLPAERYGPWSAVCGDCLCVSQASFVPLGPGLWTFPCSAGSGVWALDRCAHLRMTAGSQSVPLPLPVDDRAACPHQLSGLLPSGPGVRAVR